MKRPPVTVVVLSHRWRSHPAMVDECLASVRAQTLERMQVLFQFHEESWPEKLNEAVAASRGEHILIVPDDDRLAPHAAKVLLAVADHGDIIFSDRREFTDGQPVGTGKVLRILGEHHDVGGVYRVGISPPRFKFGSPIHMAVLIPRMWWDKLGGYANIPHADTDFLLRSSIAGARWIYVAQPLVEVRHHADQDSKGLRPTSMRAFYRKHFSVLGIDLKPDGSAVEVPEGERALYVLERFTPFTP